MIINKEYVSQENLTLPRLPIPSLNSTKTKLIEWVLPLLNSEQLQTTVTVTNEFFKEDGVAEKLQNKLNKWNQNQEGSWLTPFWEESYLTHRDPLPSSMNFNVLLKENLNKSNQTMMKTAGEVSFLIAQLYHKIINQQQGILSKEETFPDLSQLNKLFRSVRIPKLNRDAFYVADFDKKNNHIVLLYKNNIYKVPVTNDEGDIYHSTAITNAIEAAISNELIEGVNVGVFTTANRNEAAEVYTELKKSSENKATLQVIADALVVLSIDEESDNQKMAIKNLMLNGNNKYFDKTMQIIITKNGSLGFNMEHSAIDGTSVAPVIKHLSEGLLSDLSQVGVISWEITAQKMTWDLSGAILEKLSKFEQEQFNRKNQFALLPHNFNDFGAERIKKMKISPDAFFHMALQLAQYRTFGELKSVYEPVSVANFYEGRTESARSTSMEKLNLIKAIEEGIYDEEELYILMQAASEAHSSRIKECQNGQGIERHLFGLKQMYYHYGAKLGIEKLPQIFLDPGYQTLRYDFISTSGMAYENAEYRMFAPVVEDGHGVAYFILENSISVNISSYTDNKVNGEQLMDHFIEALHELKVIAENSYHPEMINWNIS